MLHHCKEHTATRYTLKLTCNWYILHSHPDEDRPGTWYIGLVACAADQSELAWHLGKSYGWTGPRTKTRKEQVIVSAPSDLQSQIFQNLSPRLKD